MTFIWILTASGLSGLIALLLALTLYKGKLWSHDRSHDFLSFAAGTLLTVAFLDLLPEAIEAYEEAAGGHAVDSAVLAVLGGFLLFFVIEKLLFWYHCHEEHCDVHTSSAMVLIGDTLHNFLDGVAIAVAFLVSPAVGVATTIAVFLHEIPQEVADFSVLLSSGMAPRRAIIFNIFSALASLGGAVLAYFFSTQIAGALPVLISLTAGGFIYVAAADLIPEIHKERRRSMMVRQFTIFLAGCAIIFAMTRLIAH
ncbi:MAG: ZIP family metal transporter [Patescibacteria group bacterium]|jgi:zinc and cadmium transporter